jgi:transcriptional regulator with XRE-family HTH domain
VIAENLKELRLARGLSQAELAQLTGTHLSYVGRAETGAYLPGSAFIRAVAAALQVSADSMLFAAGHAGAAPLGSRIDRAMQELTGEERAALETLATALVERARDRAVRRKLEQEQQSHSAG